MSITDDSRPVRTADILFLDIVGFTTLSHAAQGRAFDRLREAATAAPAFQTAQARGQMLVVTSGDGMALVFTDNLTAPARCALEIARALREGEPRIPARIGIHTGIIEPHLDISGRENVIGEGINTAHRVMECADDGHILLSDEYARLLGKLEGWADHLTDLGTALVKHSLRIGLFALHDGPIGRRDRPPALAAAPPAPKPASTEAKSADADDVVLLYRRETHPDIDLLAQLEKELDARGLRVFCDRSGRHAVETYREQERRLRAARAVVLILSPRALRSEMLLYALEAAIDERQRRGGPAVLPVQIGPAEADADNDLAIRHLVAPFAYLSWNDDNDTPRVAAEIVSALREPIRPREIPLEIVGGGMDPESPYYIERHADDKLRTLLERRHSIILVRGGRQIGKTSLLARGLQQIRGRGWRTLRTDFQKLSSDSLKSAAVFYRQLAASIVRQTRFPYDFALLWDEASDPGQNFEYFLRDLLDADDKPLVWFLDEADKVFTAAFASDFYGLIRTWHNDRASEPDGPLHRLTVVIAYATEAHLFISDLNQSPFNVGEKVALDDFSAEQVLRLNDLYGGPVRSRNDLDRLHRLLGGQPYLTRRALDSLARETEGFETLLRDAARDDGPFSDHLRRVLASISALESVTDFVRQILRGTVSPAADQDAFYRLQKAGIVRQDHEGTAVFRCDLYRRYLAEHLGAPA